MVVATLTKNVIFLKGKMWHNVDMKQADPPSRRIPGALREPLI